MPSFKTTFFAVAAAFTTTAHADYYIEPSSVSLSLRTAWCKDQKYTCPIICQQVEPRTTEENECNPETLTYSCLCGNGQQPNMTEYSLTLPYHTCQEYGNQCVAKCGLANNNCASACREDHPCGAQNPTRQNTTSTTTASATASQTSGAIFTGMAGDSGSSGSSGSGSGAAALEMGRGAGMAILVGSLLGGVAFLL